MTSYTTIGTKATGGTLPAADVNKMDAALVSLAGESTAVVAPSRLGSGTPTAATVLWGDGAWRAAPTGGGGSVGAWQDYVPVTGLAPDDPEDMPKWRDMGDGTVQVFWGRLVASGGTSLAAFATFTEAPVGFPTLRRQGDEQVPSVQIRVNGTLVTKGAVSAGGQCPPNGQGNVSVFLKA